MQIESDRILWPYEEFKIESTGEKGNYLVSTPWFKNQICFNERGRQMAERLVRGDAEPADQAGIYRALFSQLAFEPLFYQLPLLPSTPKDEQAFRGDGEIVKYPCRMASHYHCDAEYLGFKSDAWTWDLDAALALSSLAEGRLHCPKTIMSVIRRFHYLEVIELDKSAELYRCLNGLAELHAQSDGEHSRPTMLRFALAALVVARQNWYVTSRCEESLSAAVPFAQSQYAVLEHFKESERGHDLLLARAVSSISEKAGLHPDFVPVNQVTEALMASFKDFAATNFMSFAFAIDLFERTDLSIENPVARALKIAKFEVAANVFNKHHAINEDEHHAQFGFALIENMAPMARDVAMQAFRQAEFFSRLMNTHSRASLEMIEQMLSLAETAVGSEPQASL